MKKLFVATLAIAMIMALTGCAHLDDNNFPRRMYKDLQEADNKVSKAVIEEGYDYSLVEAARLISETIEKGCRYDVILLYKYDDDAKSIYVTQDEKVEYMNRDEYRRLYATEFFFKTIKAIELYDLPTDGEVVGAIISWYNIRDKWGNLNYRTYDRRSLCDIDGDNKWDWYGYGSGDFGSGTNVPEEEYIQVAKYCNVAFLCREGKVEMPDYEKSPTFRTIKSMIS